MDRFFIFFQFFDKPVAELLIDSTKRYLRYTEDGLKLSLSIEPHHLPVAPDLFEFENFLPGIEDSLPDSWGRRILSLKYPSKDITKLEVQLDLIKRACPGQLAFSRTRRFSGKLRLPSFNKIEILSKEAARLESGLKEVYGLIDSISIGGARPKVVLDSGEIAKFPSKFDGLPEEALLREFFGFEVLRRSKVKSPKTRLTNKKYLLIERFDLPDKHFISLRSLTGFEDPFNHSYSDVAKIIERFSIDKEKDLTQFSKQMIINALIFNGDAHLNNFSVFVFKKGISLTPAYDVVPSLFQKSQILSINSKKENFSRLDLERELIKIYPEIELSILDEIIEAIHETLESFKNEWVSDEAKSLMKLIDRNLIKIGKKCSKKTLKK